MPPKRRRGATEEGEPEPEGEGEGSLTRNLRLSAQSTAVTGRAAQLTSLPAKHTTSYGSPAPVLPLQGSGGYGSDLRSATRDIFAAVRRDNKKAKVQQEAEPSAPVRVTRSSSRQGSRAPTPSVDEEEPRPSSRVTRSSSRQSSRASTPVLEEGEPSGRAGRITRSSGRTGRAPTPTLDEGQPSGRAPRTTRSTRQTSRPPLPVPEEAEEEEDRPAPRTVGLLQTADIEAELRRLQARREERERAERREQERLEQERLEQERLEQERLEQERLEHERLEQERLEQERLEQERLEREERARVARQEKERAKRERAEREEKARAKRQEKERAERERQERIEREEREQAEQAERDRAQQERIAREEREQAEKEQRAEAAQHRMLDALMAGGSKPANAGADAGFVPHVPFHMPKKRTGQEFLDELFSSPKRPRNSPHAATAADMVARPPASAARSFVEESHVFRDANLQTPAPSSVMGDTPSRAPMPGSTGFRAESLHPIAERDPASADYQRVSDRPSEAADAWHIGMRPPPAPRRPESQAGPSRRPEVQHHSRTPAFAPAADEGGQGPQAGPSVAPRRPPRLADDEDGEGAQAGPSVAPRRPTRPAGKKPDLAPERRQERAEQPPAEEEPRRDDSSPPSSPGSSPKGKSAPSRKRKDPSLRLQQPNARWLVSDGAPPGDSPPPGGNFSLVDRFRDALTDWRHHLWQVLRWLGYSLAVLLALNVVFSMWHKIGSSDWEVTRSGYGLEWYGWNHMGRNIGQFLPYDIRHPLGFLDDAEYSALRDHIYSQDGRIIKLTDLSNDVRQATQQLQDILPRVISVKQDKKTSRLVIQQDFWHALKDLMHAEKSILTLERGRDGWNNISDEHWLALLRRLKAEGVLSKKDVDGIVEGAVSSSWDKWLKNNRGKVDKVTGAPAGGQPLSPDASKKIESLVREKLSGPGLRDIVVTREEFIREVEKSINEHKREAEAELARVQDNLKDMVEAATKAAQTSSGLSRREVIALTNEIVGKAISNAKLEGVAKGSINHNFESDLSHRINYFALGNGATIEKSLTSPSYSPPHHKFRFGSAQWAKAKISSPRFVPEEAAALTAWEEAGHCWCAGNKFDDADHHPADINIRLARAVVPENVVMEHIDPAATLDPKAMPKDVEVWALVDEHTRHRRARDFMFASWPATPKEHPLLAKGFLKVGQFRYDYDTATNGVLVYRLSDELARLGITADLVLVRAVTNYGADHTCFYRVRLYGSPLEGEEDKGDDAEGWRGEP